MAPVAGATGATLDFHPTISGERDSVGATEPRGALLERQQELSRVEEALDLACAGTGTAVVIEGPAGIGKSALAAAGSAYGHERGMLVLEARGTELEHEFAFGVVRQWFEPWLHRVDSESLFEGAARLATPVVLDAPGGDTPAQFAVLHGLYWLLANLSERQPLLVMVDDAQWSDEPSLRFVAYLARRVDSLPAALLVTTRTGDPGSSEPTAMSDMLSDPRIARVPLSGLSENAVGALLRERADGSVDQRFVRACHHATGGNPLLLTELERALRDLGVPFTAAGALQVPETTPVEVARSTRARLAPLGRAAGRLARAVAVLGDDVPLDLAVELAGIDAKEAAEAVASLLGAGLLEPARLLRFRHPLLRAAVEASVTPFERDAVHRQAAAMLRARGEPPERVAVHLLSTSPGLDEADVATLRRAADRAAAHGAPGTAATLLRRLLEEPLEPAERAEALLELGGCEFADGEATTANRHLEGARTIAEDPITRARAVAAMSLTTPPFADLPAHLELIKASAAEIAQTDRELALRLEAFLLMFERPGSPEADARLERAATLQGDSAAEAMVLGHLIFRRMVPGANAAEINALADRAAVHVGALVEDGAMTAAFSAVVLAMRWADRLDEAERVLERAIATARRCGSEVGYTYALSMRASVFQRRGMLREAEADARASLATSVEEAWQWVRGLPPLVECLVARGRAAEALNTLERETGERELIDIPPMLMVRLAAARVRAACGDHARALSEFDEALKRRRRYAEPAANWIGDLIVAAESHHALGDTDAASALVDRALTLARAWSTPGALGEALRAHALLVVRDDRIALLREAVDLLERSPARLVHAQALVDLGSALRRAGHRGESRGPLRTGYELAKECGADGLADSAREELAASGVRLRRERLSGVESLTPSEHRIAQMAAAENSNAEIAQALFVTIKTVEAHLTNIYRKLDVEGRRELAGALSDQAPDSRATRAKP